MRIDNVPHDNVDLPMPIFQLTEEILFPHPNLAEENGLLAIGGDLSPERLVAAYKAGIFPWFSDNDPILWWFTSPRLVIYPEEFKIPKRLLRYMKKPLFQITMDKAFEQVISNCAETRISKQEGTWVTDDMQEAYSTLHKLGYAHSVECWLGDQLAGGLYGVALGHVFFGESMFSTQSNGSKIALASLVAHLKKRDYQLIDCQMTTDHLLQFGAREISGKAFQKHLTSFITSTLPDGVWHDDPKTRY